MRRSIPRIHGSGRRGRWCWRGGSPGRRWEELFMRSLVGLIFISMVYGQAPVPLKDQAWGIITDALQDKNPDTRVQAVQSMGLIGVKEPYISTLVGMLDDKDAEVRGGTAT